MDFYEKLCERLRKMTQKNKPELGMAILEDYYLRHRLPIDSRFCEWMAHYQEYRLELNQKEGLAFNPESNSNYLAVKKYLESEPEIPEGWEEERQALIEGFAEVCKKNEAILSQNTIQK